MAAEVGEIMCLSLANQESSHWSFVGKSGEFALRREKLWTKTEECRLKTLLLFRLNARATESEPGLFQIPMNNQQQPQITNTVVRCNKTQYTFI